MLEFPTRPTPKNSPPLVPIDIAAARGPQVRFAPAGPASARAAA